MTKQQQIVLAYNDHGDVQISEDDFMQALKLAGELIIESDEDDELSNESLMWMGKYARLLSHILFHMIKEQGEKKNDDEEDEEPCKYSA